ncbi:hypothetical protein BC829DRAFT_403231 [Chytridium lagenaria]|nr:hypothetical protein BC829DRAFT_403231 [Chytridium lagenaria]
MIALIAFISFLWGSFFIKGASPVSSALPYNLSLMHSNLYFQWVDVPGFHLDLAPLSILEDMVRISPAPSVPCYSVSLIQANVFSSTKALTDFLSDNPLPFRIYAFAPSTLLGAVRSFFLAAVALLKDAEPNVHAPSFRLPWSLNLTTYLSDTPSPFASTPSTLLGAVRSFFLAAVALLKDAEPNVHAPSIRLPSSQNLTTYLSDHPTNSTFPTLSSTLLTSAIKSCHLAVVATFKVSAARVSDFYAHLAHRLHHSVTQPPPFALTFLVRMLLAGFGLHALVATSKRSLYSLIVKTGYLGLNVAGLFSSTGIVDMLWWIEQGVYQPLASSASIFRSHVTSILFSTSQHASSTTTTIPPLASTNASLVKTSTPTQSTFSVLLSPIQNLLQVILYRRKDLESRIAALERKSALDDAYISSIMQCLFETRQSVRFAGEAVGYALGQSASDVNTLRMSLEFQRQNIMRTMNRLNNFENVAAADLNRLDRQVLSFNEMNALLQEQINYLWDRGTQRRFPTPVLQVQEKYAWLGTNATFVQRRA